MFLKGRGKNGEKIMTYNWKKWRYVGRTNKKSEKR